MLCRESWALWLVQVVVILRHDEFLPLLLLERTVIMLRHKFLTPLMMQSIVALLHLVFVAVILIRQLRTTWDELALPVLVAGK